MSSLRIALLGSPRLERDGTAVTFDTRKATALLAYLAVTGTAHSRDTLGALLWPNQGQASARGALRRTLSVLNTGTGGGALAVDRSSVGLRPGAVEQLDVAELRAAAGRPLHGHPPEVGCPRCREPLTAVAALYRDDFLAGFSVRDSPEFDDWQAYQAAGLRQQLGAVLERLVGAHVAAGDPAAAVEPARRWLVLDPLAEPAHAALMRLYAWTGQRAAALRQYRECVRVLHEELGVSPLSSTTALEQAVRSGELAAAPEAPQAGVAPTRPPPAAELPRLPLVGRTQELALIGGVVEAVAGGTGRLVVLAGEPACGKSRLLEEVIRASGLSATSARCHRGEEQLALGVVADLLRSVLQPAATAAEQLPDGLRAEVGRLLPELAPPVERPAPLDSPGAQSRFQAALVAALVSSLPDGSPAVLAVEDLQWADQASTDVLAFLVRRLRDLPLLLVLTWRPDAVPAGSALREAVADAVRDGVGTPVELGRLDAGDIDVLVREALPAAHGPELAERLLAETGGLPGLVTEYLESFRRSGRPPEEDWPLPGGVRDLLQARLAALGETTQQVLSAAAVLHRDMTPGLVRATSGRGEEEVVLGLEEAARSGLLSESERDGGTYDFRQDALRRLVYESTSLARRRLLHGRAADALAQRRTPEAPAAVAAHLRLAGRDAESAEWSWRAAQRAVRLYAHEEALEHLAAAEAVGHPSALVQQASGDVLTALGRYRQALLAYGRAAATCPPQDRLTAAALEHRLAEVHHRLGAWDVADTHLTAALDLLPAAADPALRARVLADMALVAHRRGDAHAATAAAQRALLAARSARDDAALAQVHDVLGVLAAERGELTEAERHLEQSLVHADRLADAGFRVAALNNLALVLDAAGRPGEALDTAREALRLGLEHGDRHRTAALHTNLADRLHAAGERDEALAHLTAAARLFADVDDPRLRRPEIWKLVHW